MKNLPLLFETAVELGRRKSVIEPGLVVPQGYQGRVQYLLPVYLTNMQKPDLAMTLTVMDGYYLGNTCLTLEMSMLENEKYKGDALLQKSYTVDFLTKKRTQNKGEIQMFYVEDDHDAIILKRIWECVQLEIKRRKKYLEEHGTNSYSHRPERNPFASKIICGDCNKVFARKGWRSSTGVDRKVW